MELGYAIATDLRRLNLMAVRNNVTAFSITQLQTSMDTLDEFLNDLQSSFMTMSISSPSSHEAATDVEHVDSSNAGSLVAAAPSFERAHQVNASDQL